MKKQSNTLVFIPTYNESGNVENLYYEIKKLSIKTDILFLDDNSPDGTGNVIDAIVAKDESVHVIHRPGKMGLGTAHIQAFKFAREHAYDYLITMDADFTHHPCYIPLMFTNKDKTNITIGSRYISGGRMSGWGRVRLPFTYLWRNLIKYGLGMPYDCTGAFRLYQTRILRPEIYQQFKSVGFSFCMESLYYFKKNGYSVGEVPIHANNRIAGKSKLSTKIMAEVARMYCLLLVDRIFGGRKIKAYAKQTSE